MTRRKPGPKRSFLNVRDQLEYTNEVIEVFQRHGDCPVVRDELRKIHFLNRAILRKADASRAEGNRKDLYVEAPR